MRNVVFLDTVGLLAIWERRDRWHAVAKESYGRLLAERAFFVSTSHVLLECGNAASRKPYRIEAIAARVDLETMGGLIHPTLQDWETGWRAYQRGEHASAGIVDQVSIVVMKRLGIERVFSNDRHFAAAGLQPLF